jgi:hypothetical protein
MLSGGPKEQRALSPHISAGAHHMATKIAHKEREETLEKTRKISIFSSVAFPTSLSAFGVAEWMNECGRGKGEHYAELSPVNKKSSLPL